MKKIITFGIATIAVVAGAIGVQAFATSSHDENKPDTGQRSGYTEDHTDKPGENK